MKSYLLAFGFVSAILFFGCTGLLKQGGDIAASAQITDCGNDFPCFISAMQNNCSKTRVNVSEGGVAAKLEVKKANQNASCDILIKITDIQRTPDMNDEVWNGISASKGGLAFLDMTCPISAQTAQGLYGTKQILAAKEVFQKCSGSLKDVALLIVGNKVNAPVAAVPLSIEASIFPSAIKSGETVIFVAQASGGTEPYLYRLEYEQGLLSTMFSADNKGNHTYQNDLNVPKNYTATIFVRDAQNKQATKQIPITVLQADNATFVPTCIESDRAGGFQNVRVRGKAILVRADGSRMTFEDYCTSNNSVFEYDCFPSGLNAASSNPTCNAMYPGSHCSNGACVKNEQSCVDGDNGMNATGFGSITISNPQGIATTYYDSCSDNGQVFKYACNPQTNNYVMEMLDCPAGTSCSNGMCISTQQGQSVSPA